MILTKLRNCTDLNECGTAENKPNTTKTCEVTEKAEKECTPDWNCTNWSKCVNGTQNRECRDLNKCGIDEDKPLVEQSCEVKGEEATPMQPTGITGRVLANPAPLVAAILIVLLLIAGKFLYERDKF